MTALLRYIVTLRPVENNGQERERTITAVDLRQAQNIAYRRYGPHTVFGVRAVNPERPTTPGAEMKIEAL